MKNTTDKFTSKLPADTRNIVKELKEFASKFSKKSEIKWNAL